jgi:alpha-tubulin suppressor-like RCC1 family protein
MTHGVEHDQGRARALVWRLAAGAAAAALAVSATPAGAATVPHRAAVRPAAATATSGTLRAWGLDNDGQLGDGTQSTGSPVPVKVQLPAGVKVTQLRAGCNFTVALTTTGTVLAWGDNTFGQLGDGTTGGTSPTPVRVQVPAGVTVTAVRAGCRHALALTSAGQVLAWGDNTFGQLGDGTNVSSDVPVFANIPPGVQVAAISAGQYHNLALASTHTAIFSWGHNQFGQLGTGNLNDSATPVLVEIGGVVINSVAATFGDSIALISNGRVAVWGDNTFGELGDNLALPGATTPVFADTPPGVTVTGVLGGAFHILARTSSGQLLAWGLNNHGQIGDGTFTERDVPTPVSLPSGTTVTQISAGGFHSLALTSKGKVLAWGVGADGELGNGTFADSAFPVRALIPSNLAVTGIAAGPGASHSLAIVHKV